MLTEIDDFTKKHKNRRPERYLQVLGDTKARAHAAPARAIRKVDYSRPSLDVHRSILPTKNPGRTRMPLVLHLARQSF